MRALKLVYGALDSGGAPSRYETPQKASGTHWALLPHQWEWQSQQLPLDSFIQHICYTGLCKAPHRSQAVTTPVSSFMRGEWGFWSHQSIVQGHKVIKQHSGYKLRFFCLSLQHYIFLAINWGKTAHPSQLPSWHSAHVIHFDSSQTLKVPE